MKLNLICAKDELRPAMCHVQMKNGYLNATNAHVLGRVNAREFFHDSLDQLPDEFYIHATEWKKLITGNPTGFTVEGRFIVGHTRKGTNYAKFVTADELNGKYPNIDGVLPTLDNRPENVSSTFAFNPQLLSDLCEALNMSVALIMSCGEKRAHYVTCPKQEHAFGIIMPMMTDYAEECIQTIKKLKA